MAVDVNGWSERFAAQAQSIGLTETEAERVFLRAPGSHVGERFNGLLAEIAQQDPERHGKVLRLTREKAKELQRLLK